MKALFTKEMLINTTVTVAAVLVAFYIDRKFIAPKMGGSTPSGN